MESWYTYRVQKDQISSQHRVYMAEETDKKIERLRKALETYGIHNEGCSIYANYHNKCTCGFEKALKEGE